jgi:plasmid stabilization system protein ParE
MKFTVHELPKARADKRNIVEWLCERSPAGAAAWLNAYDRVVERLRIAADTLPLAPENHDVDLEVRQILFKTKRGRIYRAVFHLAGNDAYILRVRDQGKCRSLRMISLVRATHRGMRNCLGSSTGEPRCGSLSQQLGSGAG